MKSWKITYCGRTAILEHIKAETYEDALNYAQCQIDAKRGIRNEMR